MKSKVYITGCLMMVLCSSCHQFAQQTVVPIPPPAPETLCQPMAPNIAEFYTLPKPL